MPAITARRGSIPGIGITRSWRGSRSRSYRAVAVAEVNLAERGDQLVRLERVEPSGQAGVPPTVVLDGVDGAPEAGEDLDRSEHFLEDRALLGQPCDLLGQSRQRLELGEAPAQRIVGLRPGQQIPEARARCAGHDAQQPLLFGEKRVIALRQATNSPPRIPVGVRSGAAMCETTPSSPGELLGQILGPRREHGVLGRGLAAEAGGCESTAAGELDRQLAGPPPLPDVHLDAV